LYDNTEELRNETKLETLVTNPKGRDQRYQERGGSGEGTKKE